MTQETLLRRVTLDDRTKEVIADEYKAECDGNHAWRAKLPGKVPRTITTIYYYDFGSKDTPDTV